ncbi:MAG TPA: hypothetical protein VIW94_01505 [Acidimicrobiia bacterium]
MKLAGVTRMTRSASPKYPSVRNALIGALAAGVVGFAYDFIVNDSIGLIDSASVAVVAFLGWAIAREIDPDYPSSGPVALAGAGLLAIWTHPHLLLSAVALGAVRLLVGTVGGGGPTTVDLFVLVGMAGYAGWQVDGWAIAVIIVVGIMVAAGPKSWPWALAAASLATAGALLSSDRVDPGDESARILAYPVLFIMAVLLALPITTNSVSDIGKRPLDSRRLRAARILAAIAVAASAVVSDVYGLTNLGPLTAAVFSAAIAVPFTRRQSSAL